MTLLLPSSVVSRARRWAGGGIEAGAVVASGRPTREQSANEPFALLMSTAPVWAFIKDQSGHYRYVNTLMESRLDARFGNTWFGRTDVDLWPMDIAAMLRLNDQSALDGGALQVFSQIVPVGNEIHTVLTMKFPLVGFEGERLVGGIGIDISETEGIEAERDRLATAIGQVAESVVITDLDARITYVNPAFERVTGYSRQEAVGQNPRIIASGLHEASFYAAMWAALTNGEPWVADFTNKRKDGTLFSEEAVISPIRDAAGTVTSYVAVKRDVTRERSIVLHAEQITRERALIANTIRSLGPRDTPEATAEAICKQVASLTGMAAAQLLVFELDGRAMVLGFVVTGEPNPPLRRIPQQRSQQLLERATEGPWIEPWVDRPLHPYNDLLNTLKVSLVAWAPIRYDGRLIGLLSVDAVGTPSPTTVTDNLPALVEFADLAGVLIGRDVAERTEVSRARGRIQSVIDDQAFRIVFQPIVDLQSNAVVGYEALSRFHDGVAPDVRFGEASGVGLGMSLEIATLRTAIAEGRRLPEGTWLNLNVSPDLILAGEPLKDLLLECDRRIILEVTEHAAIADYPAFRTALADLGPQVSLAVDDAGAGFASLRHIIELRPAFVKLDRSLVAGVDTDEALQAMIVGLCHFARSTGALLLAEGVERPAERDMLRSLAIPFAQGYLFGRPARAEAGIATAGGFAIDTGGVPTT